ncbi:polysaccharide biosynthesis protein [Plantactinospora sp. GCM10030261]|uniref:polysaccharide biosynthesis protein n=1 Tax=Plantactinospora sp. GCM10030261 TaxID=3273420 RepID=UPI003615C239
MRRLLNLVPAGTIAVGGGLTLLGLASYVHLAVAGHNLDASGYSSLSVLWSIVFTVGIGVFTPIEQETARLVATRHSQGLSSGPVLARAGLVAVGILAVLFGALALTADVLAERLFDGDRSLVWALAGGLAGLAAVHTARGLFSGRQMFGAYGTQLGLDGGLRVVLVAGLGLAGVDSTLWYGLVLVVAPLVAVVFTLPPAVRLLGSGPAVPWRPMLRGLGLLATSSLLMQFIINVGVINVKLLAPADIAAAGALLSALVLVRIPLFAFASIQASLLPGLSTATATGDLSAFRGLLRRALTLVTAVGVAGAVVAVPLGPWLVRVLFDQPNILGPIDFIWLSAGTLGCLWAMVLGQALLASGRHRAQAVAWVVGVVSLIIVTLLPMAVVLRVEIAYATGTLAVAAAMAAALRRDRVAAATAAPDIAPAASPGGLR